MAIDNSTSAAGSTRSKAVTKPRRKTKSVSNARTIRLSPAMIYLHAREKAQKEYRAFMDSITEAEMRIIGRIKPFDYDYDPVKLMNEFRRLLGESAAKCKVIPFPIERTRQSRSLEA